jgi:hypothetical protein
VLFSPRANIHWTRRYFQGRLYVLSFWLQIPFHAREKLQNKMQFNFYGNNLFFLTILVRANEREWICCVTQNLKYFFSIFRWASTSICLLCRRWSRKMLALRPWNFWHLYDRPPDYKFHVQLVVCLTGWLTSCLTNLSTLQSSQGKKGIKKKLWARKSGEKVAIPTNLTICNVWPHAKYVKTPFNKAQIRQNQGKNTLN